MPRFNEYGLELIKSFEALHLTAYQDSARIWTVGFGHTSDHNLKVDQSTKITEAQAEDLLKKDVAEAEQLVKIIDTGKLNDNQYSTLVSIAYNSGAFRVKNKMGKWVDVKLVNLIKNGELQAAGDAILDYKVTAGGVRLKGLENRRRAEWRLWNLSPDAQVLAEDWVKEIRNDIYERKLYG